MSSKFSVADCEIVELLGVKVHCIDMDGALGVVRGFLESGEPHIVVTADASAMVIAHKDAEFREIVNGADLVTPDGAGVLLGAKLLRRPLKQRVSGVDMARELCKIGALEGYPMYFLGAAPGVADLAAENMKAAYPGLKIAGVRDGYFRPEQDTEIVEAIRNSGAKILLVAMGIPKQEKWIRAHLDKLGVCVAIGVGGTLDVLSGNVKRAPMWMQQHGLEWLYRLAKNPSKISKVKTLPVFGFLIIKEHFLGRI